MKPWETYIVQAEYTHEPIVAKLSRFIAGGRFAVVHRPEDEDMQSEWAIDANSEVFIYRKEKP